MASKREAFRLGYDVGYGIAEENFRDFFSQYDEEEGEPFVDDRSEIIDFIAGKASEVESEHYRQFSPFEFTAQDFNRSRDPDAVWEAYDNGVYRGAKVAAEQALRTLRKAFVLP